MKKNEIIQVMIFAYIMASAIIWVRINLTRFLPILEASTLFFQLILAATIIAIIRNIIGLKTFGVFGPAIIAFGLVESGLLWGLALYLDVFMVALFTSMALYSLGMPSSHRMAVVIISTVIVITILELIAEIYHMGVLEQSILFPVLITSWLADRYVKMVKETDWIAPSKRLLGTFIAIIVAFYIIHFEPLIMFIAVNPETWGLLILLNIILSMKVNFRLSEYIRFKPVIRKQGNSSSLLALNRRNRDYIFKFNPANVNPLITKDKMKITMHQLSIPTPETYAIIERKKELNYAGSIMESKDSFVIKPSSGLGGEGILVVTTDEQQGIRRYWAKDREYSLSELRNHMNMILEGQFSTEWEDVAIIEEMVVTDPRISDFYWKGVPDIRVIVLEGFPSCR